MGYYGSALIPALVVLVVGLVRSNQKERTIALQAQAELTHEEMATRENFARQEERDRIARDMHDTLSHRLSMIAVYAGGLAYRQDLDPEETRKSARTIRDEAEAAVGDLREALHSLRSEGRIDPREGVESLVERCTRVQPGQTVLVPAAAGGVGVLLCQWLKSKDVTVIGTVGSPAKVEIARAAGADHVLAYDEVPVRVRELTGGNGVDAVIDGVGKATFDSSLDSLKRRGILASFGNASGPAGPLEIGLLARKGSLFVTRPTLFDYYATPEDFAAGTAAVFAKIEVGVLKAHIGQTFALADAVAAHKALEARQTVGSSLLIP